MVRRGHMAGPHESTWTPTWCLHDVYSNGLTVDGPMG